jgi:hypothetical protein
LRGRRQQLRWWRFLTDFGGARSANSSFDRRRADGDEAETFAAAARWYTILTTRAITTSVPPTIGARKKPLHLYATTAPGSIFDEKM